MFNVRLIFLPEFINETALQKTLTLPFVPVIGLAIETSEDGEALGPTSLPYVDSVTWNLHRKQFDCVVAFRFGGENNAKCDRIAFDDLVSDGWRTLT